MSHSAAGRLRHKVLTTNNNTLADNILYMLRTVQIILDALTSSMAAANGPNLVGPTIPQHLDKEHLVALKVSCRQERPKGLPVLVDV